MSTPIPGDLHDTRILHHSALIFSLQVALIKFGVEDNVPGGVLFEEGMAASKILKGTGIDCIEPSVGLRGKTYDKTEFKTGINAIGKEAYYREW